MTLHLQASGGEYWPPSPGLDGQDPSSLANCILESMDLETERTTGSRGSINFVSAPEFSSDPVTPAEDIPAAFPESEVSHVDLHDWYSRHQACLRFFLDQSQHTIPVQSVAAFVNIRLPCQRVPNPVMNVGTPASPSAAATVSSRSYIRRLIVTGQDTPAILRMFFGDDWLAGVGCVWRQERLNYLFAAKSDGWASTKTAYDILPDEHTPFLRPLREATEEELDMAETRWSEWLAMEDWMLGSRSPW
ncbi:uncharacterized protein ACLA_035700 [Aspergillus clavatus NRRL 1]|uniref:Uncharacterized protein n=1 Tax=Aspergillus clavatus (strain ATCC 1007 / CBS 513.65 / DSM 816 / NCTC 3887 / NRRL 1 / QM 1276 / 107) TaxID=344612 RepID=A1CJP3_ASPCL|nr:uncharacterized protein ACLA_035700 [Aspergillus clavatus NRRL 1]EAW09367.1 conserved hypothetical protein [Aspergillus clavatus NRRL 1]